jgi:dTDP-4-dehydrorhamnose reductase
VRALITGGGGQLASDLALLLGPDARAFSHAELDICDQTAVDRAYGEVEPEVVLNCAAFHNLDVCERESARAWSVNADAVLALARRRVPMVHLSTNYVFDGRREEPYAETDRPSPRSVYALSKLAGEYAALAYGTRPLVVRAAGLYGLHGSASKGGNFVQRMLARAREGGPLRVVADQRLQPTFTADLAAAIVEAIARDAEGVVHLTASGSCSWYEFTQAIMARAGLDVEIEPTATGAPANGVDRPLNGVLARTEADSLGIGAMRSWDAALSDYMDRAGLTAGAHAGLRA